MTLVTRWLAFALPGVLAPLLLPALSARAEEASPRNVVAIFHEALSEGDRSKALGLLAPRVVIFEEGGAENSRDEYASHHLDADIRFAQATERRVIRQFGSSGPQHAWLLSWVERSGSFRGLPVHRSIVETMILTRTTDRWQIVHIHWSTREGTPR